MRIFAPNRHELWFSFAFAFYAVWQARLPAGFSDSLILSAGLLIAFFCAVNAFLDRDDMGLVERMLSGYWLVLLTVLTPCVIYGLSTIKTFAIK